MFVGFFAFPFSFFSSFLSGSFLFLLVVLASVSFLCVDYTSLFSEGFNCAAASILLLISNFSLMFCFRRTEVLSMGGGALSCAPFPFLS